MVSTAFLLAPAGALLVTGAWLQYLASIPKEKVPEDPKVHSGVMALGGTLGVAGVALSGGAAALGSAGAALGLAGFWFYLLRQAPLPDGELVVGVGDPFPAFSALDSKGQPFTSDQLKGKRILFKFFRGHW